MVTPNLVLDREVVQQALLLLAVVLAQLKAVDKGKEAMEPLTDLVPHQ
jgi:hypothetical protein